MRELKENEKKEVYDKLSKYIGDNMKLLLSRPDDKYSFKLHRERIFYVKDSISKRAEHIPRKQLLSFGTCFGRFTKSGVFRLQITALDYLAPYAKNKVWLKAPAEQQFLYGQHVVKSGLARISDSTDQYSGVVVYSLSDIPLGFGVAAKSTQQCRSTDPMTIVVFHQADVGEYIRSEETLL